MQLRESSAVKKIWNDYVEINENRMILQSDIELDSLTLLNCSKFNTAIPDP